MADNDILQGFQLGFQSSLQRQEMRSQAALRRLQEQQIAQVMALRMQENALQNQFRAEMATAAQAMQDATSEEFMVPMPGAEVGTSVPGSDMAPPLMPVKNPSPMRRIDAFTQFMLPVISKFAPDKAGPIYNDVISNEVRMQQETQPQSPLGRLQADRAAALRRGDMAAVAEFDSLIKSEQFEPTGGVADVPTPEGGTRKVPYVKTSPRSAQLVIDPTIENIKNPETGATTPVLRTGTSSARVIPENIEDRQNRMAVLRATIDKASHLLEVDEKGNAFLPPSKFNEAMRVSGVPTAVKTQMMEQLVATAGAFEVGNLLLPLLTPANVGASGWLARNLVDKGVAQVYPWMKIGRASDTRAIATNFRSGLIKAMKSDSNITQTEINEITDGLPTPDEFMSSPQESKSVLAQQLELAAIKSRAAANVLGKPITPFYLTKGEIRDMLATGSITESEADKFMASNAWELIARIRAEVQR